MGKYLWNWKNREIQEKTSYIAGLSTEEVRDFLLKVLYDESHRGQDAESPLSYTWITPDANTEKIPISVS